jgi:hypothetical protein
MELYKDVILKSQTTNFNNYHTTETELSHSKCCHPEMPSHDWLTSNCLKRASGLCLPELPKSRGASPPPLHPKHYPSHQHCRIVFIPFMY